MSESGGNTRAIVWLRPDQAELVRQIGAEVELTIIGAGTGERAKAGEVASALGVDPVNDLRAVLAGEECDLVLIAAPGDFGLAGEPQDAAAAMAARARGVRIATLEPLPSSASDLATIWHRAQHGVRPSEAIRFMPLMRVDPAFVELGEVREPFGHVRSMCARSLARPDEASLGALLFSAIDAVHAIMGEPEYIDAAYVGPSHARGVHALPGETLRGLRGDMTVNLRFPDGRAACLLVSDQGGAWTRSATLLGNGGRIDLDEGGFVWTGRDGERVDEHVTGPSDPRTRGVRAIARALRRMMDPHTPEEGPTDHGAVLAIAQAALLSARTGQAESPATFHRMLSRA